MDIHYREDESNGAHTELMQRFPAEQKLYVAAAIALLMVIAGAAIAANTEVLNLAMFHMGWAR